MSIGDRIKQVRGTLSRKIFADKFGIHPNTLARWESEDREPGFEFISEMVDKFNLSPEWVIFGTGPMERKDTKESDKKKNEGADKEDLKDKLSEGELEGEPLGDTQPVNFFMGVGEAAPKKPPPKKGEKMSDRLLSFIAAEGREHSEGDLWGIIKDLQEDKRYLRSELSHARSCTGDEMGMLRGEVSSLRRENRYLREENQKLREEISQSRETKK